MERFFIFDMLNTWYDWKLIVTAKDITPPTPKTNYVVIDGMNGTLDLSESLTGEVVYNDRTITASFWTCDGTRKEREKLLHDIAVALHGRKVKITEPDDPDHYFYGRVIIKSRKNTAAYAEFTIEATCDPWRYADSETVRTVEATTNGSNIVINNNSVKTLCPTITVVGNAVVNGVELSTGSYLIPDIKLYHGANVFSVTGDGSVSFAYREADL